MVVNSPGTAKISNCPTFRTCTSTMEGCLHPPAPRNTCYYLPTMPSLYRLNKARSKWNTTMPATHTTVPHLITTVTGPAATTSTTTTTTSIATINSVTAAAAPAAQVLHGFILYTTHKNHVGSHSQRLYRSESVALLPQLACLSIKWAMQDVGPCQNLPCQWPGLHA